MPNIRDIVVLPFDVGDGSIEKHSGIIISNDDVYGVENFFYAVMMSTKTINPEFHFILTPDMVNYQPGRYVNKATSYVKTQLINVFYEDEIISRVGTMKIEPFKLLLNAINKKVFSHTCKQ